MFDKDKWLEILQIVLRNPIRAFLSGLGVSWGIIMLIITIGSVNGLQNGIRADSENRAANSMFLWTQQTSMPHKGFKSGRYFQLNNSDVEYLRRNLTTVDLVSPRIQLGGYNGSNNVTRGVETGAFNIYGDTPDYIDIEPNDIYQGRYINQRDIEEERKVCVIGKRVYEVLFPDGSEAVGEYIRINGVNFLVVGMYRSFRTGEDAEEATQSIFVPITTFQKAFHFGDYVGWLSILIKEGVNANDGADEVVAALKARKSVHPDDPRAFGFWTMAEELEEIELVFTGFNIVGFFFGGLVLLAGIIGIVNIMLITVKERTKEIGIRRGLGATPRKVIEQIILETIFLTTIAGLGGMVFGVLLIDIVAEVLSMSGESGSFRNPGVKLVIVVSILAFMIIMGAFAGLLPALRAVSIKPVDALRAD
ncbi:MAG: ABC transporter permease [Flavobacteriales bacterium]|nr:ABC transporter permease [Flavobacteriales bacterium]